MRRYAVVLLAVLSVLLTQAIAFADVKSFKTIPGDKKNVVEFTSKATMETIVGKTSSIDGAFDLNLDSLALSKNGSFDVDLNSISTGIDMRDGHMRDKFLETAKFPKASFKMSKVVSIDKPSLKPGESANMVVEGEFSIHGVSKTYQIPVKLTYQHTSQEASQRMYGSKGDLLVVSAQWNVKLADHAIEKPQLLMMRIADEQIVNVDFVMTDQLPDKK